MNKTAFTIIAIATLLLASFIPLAEKRCGKGRKNKSS